MSIRNMYKHASMMRYFLFAAIILSTLIGSMMIPYPTKAASPIYVDASLSAAGNGLSWATAFNSLQSAINAASNGDEIWVADGVYKPSALFIAGDVRSAAFTLKNGVKILGGFAGGETLLSSRNPAVNIAILSGAITPNGASPYNVYHVVRSIDNPASTVLDGFTITGGLADLAMDQENTGGGMITKDSAAHLSNLIFRMNTATLNGGGLSASSSYLVLDHVSFERNTSISGGGLYDHSGSLTLTNVSFSGNQATAGAGAFEANSPASTYTDIKFVANRSTGDGGGMYIFRSGPILDRVSFINNEAGTANGNIVLTVGQGGGLKIDPVSDVNIIPVVKNSTFSGNKSTGPGAGIYNYKSSGSFINIDFIGNHAIDYGGGFYSRESGPLLINDRFIGNVSDFYGGGLAFDVVSTPIIVNAVVNGNIASQGAGMFVTGPISEPNIYNSTFTQNVASSTKGSALFVFNFDLSYNPVTKIVNTIMFNNIGAEQITLEGSTPDISYSDIQGALLPGTGNRNVDPQFIDPNGADNIAGNLDDNLRLLSSSPLIDSGSNSSLPADSLDLNSNGNTTEPVPFDVVHHARRVDILSVTDTGEGTAPIVDMGAYEKQIFDLTVIKGVDHLTSYEGDLLNFSITVSNTGDSPATGVVIQDVVPALFIVQNGSFSTTMGTPSYDALTQTIHVSGVSLAANESVIVTYSASSRDNGSATNSATVTAVGIAGSLQDSITLIVNNAAPTVTLDPVSSQNEGSVVSFNGHFGDAVAEDGPYTYAWNWGDGSILETGTVSVFGQQNGTHTFADNGTYTVSLTIFDKDGGANTATRIVQVVNVAPTIIAPDHKVSFPKITRTFTATFSDPAGSFDGPYQVTWDFGDGTPIVNQNDVAYNTLLSQRHVYMDKGVRHLIITITDKDGAVGTKDITIDVDGNSWFIPLVTGRGK